MNDRDIIVFMLALIVGVTVGVLDTLIDIDPEAQDGMLTAALVVAVAWGFYKLGRTGGV